MEMKPRPTGATPTPWTYDEINGGYTISTVDDDPETARSICTTFLGHKGDTRYVNDESQANVALIVRAVNAHQELVKALNTALAIVDAYAEEADSKLTQKFWDDRDEIVEAIVKAEQGRNL